MSLGPRIWNAARQQLRKRLGLVQGTVFLRKDYHLTSDAREELEGWLREGGISGPKRERAPEPPPAEKAKTQTVPPRPTPPPPRPFEREYRLLEAPVGSGLTAVRTAWRRAVRKNHPDLYAPGSLEQREASARLREVNEAYARLKAHLEPRDNAK